MDRLDRTVPKTTGGAAADDPSPQPAAAPGFVIETRRSIDLAPFAARERDPALNGTLGEAPREAGAAPTRPASALDAAFTVLPNDGAADAPRSDAPADTGRAQAGVEAPAIVERPSNHDAPADAGDDRALVAPVDPPRAIAPLGPVVESARRYAESARAPRTRKEYDKHWRAFVRWCDAHDLKALPADPGTVALYLAARADQGRTVATIAVALAAIVEAHKLRSYPSPRLAGVVRETWKGIKRRIGRPQRRVAPVEVESLRQMIAALPHNRRGLRDRAILTLGFAGAFRRSELVGLRVGDVVFTKDGLVVTLRRSKTDQEGAGTTVGIPFGGHPDSCPVRTLRAWLDVAALPGSGAETAGDAIALPLFRSVSRHDRLGGPLDGKDVERLVKRATLAAGFDPLVVSGHSLRAGLATAAAKAGKPDRAIMRQGRWRSRTIMDRYVRDGELFKENAAAGIGL